MTPAPESDHPAPVAPLDTFSAEDYILLVKGAPDVLIKRCGYINDPSTGSTVPLTQPLLDRLVATQESFAAKGERVLLLAKRVIHRSMLEKAPSFDDSGFGDFIQSELNHDLVVVGLLSLVDPPRPEIPEVMRTLRGAGIRVMMVTGDFALTALAIAEKCGIVSNASTAHHFTDLELDVDPAIPAPDTKGDTDIIKQGRAIVLSGTDLMQMNELQWDQVCTYEEVVFARTSPEQKLRIVKEFQRRGHTVGMTGDGVNDAPSLKAADIGIAIGGGSDVAIEAADLVLLES